LEGIVKFEGQGEAEGDMAKSAGTKNINAKEKKTSQRLRNSSKKRGNRRFHHGPQIVVNSKRGATIKKDR